MLIYGNTFNSVSLYKARLMSASTHIFACFARSVHYTLQAESLVFSLTNVTWSICTPPKQTPLQIWSYILSVIYYQKLFSVYWVSTNCLCLGEYIFHLLKVQLHTIQFVIFPEWAFDLKRIFDSDIIIRRKNWIMSSNSPWFLNSDFSWKVCRKSKFFKISNVENIIFNIYLVKVIYVTSM
jgi:hypothetical protein